MKFFQISPLLSLLTSLVVCADISTDTGPFTLITTPDSTIPPTTVTGYVDLFYEAPQDSTTQVLWLFLVPSGSSYNEQFQMNGGVLGTTRCPDDCQGSLAYNATTPATGSQVAFSPQYAAHAGFDINNGYLAIHGVTDNTFYLCPYTYDGGTAFQILTYAASAVAGCTVTRVYVQH
ncbi:hypothetical protein FRB94_006677 [Tulasnella sp. JGI-2019a]|nr:hypothetical protein FRB94_006677 [Tulasnella sp. JGI-2019a]